jgi:hypothetical protein
MALTEVQRALARLYVDGDLRMRFFAAPGSLGAELHLEPSEIDSLASLAEEVEWYARSLLHKRAEEVARLLPRTRDALDRAFRPLFFRYAESRPIDPARRHAGDAIRFAPFLASADAGRGEPPVPSWIGDLARYEAGWLRAESLARGVLAVRLRHRVQPARTGDAEREPPVGGSLALWLRLTPAGRLRHWLLPTG